LSTPFARRRFATVQSAPQEKRKASRLLPDEQGRGAI
jgi:hypothetical protein